MHRTLSRISTEASWKVHRACLWLQPISWRSTDVPLIFCPLTIIGTSGHWDFISSMYKLCIYYTYNTLTQSLNQFRSIDRAWSIIFLLAIVKSNDKVIYSYQLFIYHSGQSKLSSLRNCHFFKWPLPLPADSHGTGNMSACNGAGDGDAYELCSASSTAADSNHLTAAQSSSLASSSSVMSLPIKELSTCLAYMANDQSREQKPLLDFLVSSPSQHSSSSGAIVICFLRRFGCPVCRQVYTRSYYLNLQSY